MGFGIFWASAAASRWASSDILYHHDIQHLQNLVISSGINKQNLLFNLQDVHFLINIASAHQSNSARCYIQIYITPDRQSPHLPSAATKLKNIPAGAVPYISPTNLLVFKINSYELRAQDAKKRADAQDAETLIISQGVQAPLKPTAQQQNIVEPCIADVTTSEHVAAVATTEYWTWSKQHQDWYHMNDHGSCEWSSAAIGQ
ncbi:hypothetical protein B0H63DRAFT_527465 [Podospora didyma]|uniref:Uncharacterized protein n=1 Tax=Podospora didyma TaxID=330526 RepID=A0AAE0KAQ2_9PEZI|nr:hypothetical protein B0H63DRAFT_527465 [Podospora didyma]